jgi:hypothetical protein
MCVMKIFTTTRFLAIVSCLAVGALAHAGTLTVTSPTEGAHLGTSNQLRFIIRDATLEVTVRAIVTGPGGSTTIEQKFTPNAEGRVDSQLALNFSSSSPEGPYTIRVTATEPGNTYNEVLINVTVDVTPPKFLEFNPNPNSFVRGTVPIFVKLDEPNVKEFRVQINNQDIPNNTGGPDDVVNGTFVVHWDTSGIELDGPQTITIRVKDLADNESTRTINVRLDRVAPIVTIQYPNAATFLRPGATIAVVVDIQDASTSSVDITGIDVVLTRLDGSYLMRVPLMSLRPSGSNVLRWSGRVRWRPGLLPSQFRIRATAVDRAGNVANVQEATLKIGR